jgi:hypothetical protein
MQRDIRQENRMNTLIISEGQKMHLKFFKNTLLDRKTRTLEFFHLLINLRFKKVNNNNK